ncbi:MAG: CHASE domain-containing protein [Ignavibacteriales bacterium]|nr:CHASE domain-containing protein [Ignavibacteriales bacterium]
MFSSNNSGSRSTIALDWKNKFLANILIRIIKNKKIWLFWFVLAVGLLFTWIEAMNVKRTILLDAKQEFEFVCNEIKNKIITRLEVHAQILRSGSAFFESSTDVTREEWRKFIEQQRIENNLPGIQGVGFSLIIPKNQLVSHEQKIRSEGFPQYAVKPAGKRDIYTSIIYLEPFVDRNLRAFGYDMFSEPIRRKAMEYARDYNVASLSGKITLVQETEKDIQAGTLMYVPVYKSNLPVETIEERRISILGWVYSPYRMNDLMNGILGGYGLIEGKQYQLQIYDDSTFNSNVLMFDSRLDKNKINNLSSSHIFLSQIEFNNHTWFVRITQADNSTSNIDYSKVWIVAIAGSAVSILLAIVFLILANLSQTHKNYASFFNTIDELLFVLDDQQKIIHTNKIFLNRLGYLKNELIGKSVFEIYPTDRRKEAVKIISEILSGNEEFCPVPVITKSGIQIPVETRVSRGFWNGKHSIFGVAKDISKLRLSEERFSKVFYLNPSACGLTDLDNHKFVEVNDAFCNLFGFSKDEVIGKTGSDLGIINAKVLNDTFSKLDNNGVIKTIEADLKAKNGNIKHVMLLADIINVQDKKFRFTVFNDITESKLAEDEIKRQLQEKEVLLREVHHRIKNNITSIGNLLSIHANSISNPEALSILQDAIGRVQSVALIYNKLLLTDDYQDISVKKYFEDLIDAVVNIFSLNDSVVIVKEIDDFALDVKRIFPLGTIVNELLTDSLKYAFVNKNSGLIVIKLEKNGNHISLAIKDNGNGLPKGFDVSESNGLGLMLVKMLCQQLGATFKIESEQGTRSTIEFDV